MSLNDKECRATVDFNYRGEPRKISHTGNGPIDAVKQAINEAFGLDMCVLSFDEHALGSGSQARAACYIQMKDETTGKVLFGAGDSANITKASIRAFFSGLNRLTRKMHPEL